MSKYILKKSDIEAMQGLAKQHFLNPDAQRINKSLGDLTGLTGIGFHIIEVPPGKSSTEYHVHHYEDECVYILAGTASAVIDEESYDVGAGDFIGYPAGGLAHTLLNTGDGVLQCIVVGQRLEHDVSDYPRLAKRLYRHAGRPWEMVDVQHVSNPQGGRKV